MDLDGKVALVTGAARRVGRAIALELGRAGARVVIHHHDSAKEAAEVKALLGQGWPLQADLTDPHAIKGLFAQIRRLGGGVDVLVNSASPFERGSFDELSDEQWDHALSLGLMAPVRCAREAAQDMRRRGGGVIVNILDVAAYVPWRTYAHHCVAKAGLAMLTKCLALELAPQVRTVGVAPGTVLFPEAFSTEQRERIQAKIPLGRVGSPEDVARAVRSLVEQDFVNGAVLAVDGGRLLESGEAY